MRFLRERGCHEMQGYLFGRPGPVDAIEAMLKGGGAALDPTLDADGA